MQSKSVSKGAWIAQAFLLAVVVGMGFWLALNAHNNLSARGLSAGFDFLADAAGFDISESMIAYDATQSYWRAFGVGVLNTIRAAVPAVVLATVLGFAMGVASISTNAVVRAVVRLWVDVVRNIPLLVQVLVWYFMLTELLPNPAAPWSAGPVFLSKMGLALPDPFQGGSPSVGVFGVTGGMVVSPELLALVGALTIYAAAYCTEIVRAGLTAVPRGQWEAAHALSINRASTLRRVIIPQGLRVMFPPYISLALSTIKNSSLAVAIGYPDIVAVATTTLNQTGRAIECISIIAAVYLTLNLVTSLVMNIYNRRAQIRER